MADTVKQPHERQSQHLLVSRHLTSYSKGKPAIVAMVISCITIGLTALVVVLLTTRPSTTTFFPSLSARHTKEDSPQSLCDSFPQLYSIPLPERCQVSYANGHITNSTSYTLGQCSNCLCLPSNWARSVHTRHCCRPVSVTNITYSCPHYLNGETVIIGNVPVSCECQPCGADEDVVFILRVQDENLKPVILANVTVNGMTSYATDDNGYVGFTVSASLSKVYLRAMAVGYEEIEDNYFVLPGQTNSLTLMLTSLTYRTFVPPQTPFLLSLKDLSVHQLPIDFSFKMLTSAQLKPLLPAGVWNYNELFVYFPNQFFPSNQFTFLSSPADQYFSSFKVSYTAYNDGLSYRTPLYAVLSGRLDIQDENGVPFISTTNEEDPLKRYGVLTQFTNDFQSSSHRPHLFIYNTSNKQFEKTSKEKNVMSINRDSAHLHLFTPHTIAFPQTYLIAVQEPTSCFISVTARDMNGALQTKQDKLSTVVKATTKIWYSENDWMSSVAYGHIDSCLAVPCRGELMMRVLGLPEEDNQQDVQLSNIEMELREVADGSSRVFRSETECKKLGLEVHAKTDVSLSRSVHVDLVPDYCIDTQPMSSYFSSKPTSKYSPAIDYCSVQIALSFPPYASAIITATTDNSEMITQRIEPFSTAAEVDEPQNTDGVIDFGSGSSGSGTVPVEDEMPANNRHFHFQCFTFPCTQEVTLTARLHVDALNNAHHPANDVHYPNDYFKETLYGVGSKIDNERNGVHSTCLPYAAPPLTILNANEETLYRFLVNLAQPGSGEFTYRADGSHFGVFVSRDVPQIAYEKCRRSQNAGIQFQCPSYQ